MNRRIVIPTPIVILVGLTALSLSATRAGAQQEPAVNSGVQYLKQHIPGVAGQAAMVALGLMKADVPHGDPAVQACLTRVRSRFGSGGGYSPQMGDGAGTYEAAASILALSTENSDANRGSIAQIAAYLISRQNANGSWDYVGRPQGDTSISQYAVLGLWEAENDGSDVPPAVWDRAASWYISVQSSGGSWNYHRDTPTYPETCAMTAAGVGSLLICQRQLDRYRSTRRETSPLMTALVSDTERADYRPSTSNAQINQAATRGMSWLSSNFAPNNPALAGQSPYYMLYGVERIGALADKQTLGKVDWYAKGRDFIRSTQASDGSWTGQHGNDMNTVWSILFLVKSTAKTIQKITIRPRLGAGTLLGGRDLPQDLTSMTVAGGRVVSRPMNGAIEGMLAALEDPRAEKADSAVAGMVDRYYKEGPAALRPYKVRFRKMLSDRDPGLRRVAAWALAHTGDLDVVPQLIDSLVTPGEDEEVIAAARMGLNLLSRKINGLGPPSPSNADERKAAAQRWREWFEAIRPLDLDDHGEGAPPPKASAPAPADSASRSVPP